VTTVELADYKIGLAAANFARAGLARYISIVHDDAGRVLERSADRSFDLIFLDSERPEYPGWWPNLRRVLRPGGLLVVDNANRWRRSWRWSVPTLSSPLASCQSATASFSRYEPLSEAGYLLVALRLVSNCRSSEITQYEVCYPFSLKHGRLRF
jgi:spermidine synthase